MTGSAVSTEINLIIVTGHDISPLGTKAAAAENSNAARIRLIIILLLLSAFVMSLNENIMGVAPPTLLIDLSTTASAAQWLMAGVLLTMAVIIPITGFLLQRFNTRPLLISAMGLFSAGTLIIGAVIVGAVIVSAVIVSADLFGLTMLDESSSIWWVLAAPLYLHGSGYSSAVPDRRDHLRAGYPRRAVHSEARGFRARGSDVRTLSLCSPLRRCPVDGHRRSGLIVGTSSSRRRP